MSDNYLFSTHRLGFRLLTDKDIAMFAELDHEATAEKFLPEKNEINRFASRIGEFITQYQARGLPCFTIIDLETDEYAGSCGFAPNEIGEVEVGYIFLKKYWGKGFATETLDALIKWAKKNLDVEYIIGYTVAEHLASCRVMEKCGMKFYKNDVAKGVLCRFYHVKVK